jgi:hypothetical protein
MTALPLTRNYKPRANRRPTEADPMADTERTFSDADLDAAVANINRHRRQEGREEIPWTPLTTTPEEEQQ